MIFSTVETDFCKLSDEEDRTEAVLTMTVMITFTVIIPISAINEHNKIEQLWTSFTHDNKDYTKAWQVIRKGVRQFPSELNLKTSITEYQVNNNDTL